MCSRSSRRASTAPSPDSPRRRMQRDLRFLILAEGQFGPLTSKTANSCIRYTPERVVAVLDSRRAGRMVEQVLGFGGSIPVVPSADEGLRYAPTALLIGVAPQGG